MLLQKSKLHATVTFVSGLANPAAQKNITYINMGVEPMFQHTSFYHALLDGDDDVEWRGRDVVEGMSQLCSH